MKPFFHADYAWRPLDFKLPLSVRDTAQACQMGRINSRPLLAAPTIENVDGGLGFVR
jgi:hypothetical protein